MRPLTTAALLLGFVLSPVTDSSPVSAAEHNILMIAGAPSHNYGAHEHYAGLKIIAEAIENSSDDAKCSVVRGWPKDESVIDQADSIVIYSDGGGRHPAFNHRDKLRNVLSKGTGFVCIHYATEMVPGEAGDDMIDLLGGHFEINYSVNPHWVAEFKTLPDHPVTNGVEPFATNDEWYFHLRFSDKGKVTPILAAVAPQTTMNRPDGAHSGNPHVRKSVERGETQTVAWTFDRPDGGRSFGITGGHYHWNWGNDDMLRVVTNAIRWTAGETIEPGGSSLGHEPVEMNDLLQNQAYVPPETFDAAKTAKEFAVPGGEKAKMPEVREDQIPQRKRKPAKKK